MKSREVDATGNEPGGHGFGDKRVSRREFLKVAGIAGATVGVGAGLGGLVAACGGGATTTTTTAGTSTSITTATTAAASTTTVSSGPEAGRVVKLGLVSPQTGMLADFSITDKWWVAHAETAVKDGLVCGDGKLHKIEIVVRNSTSDSNRAAQVAGDLINNDKIDMMMVSATADTVNPVSDQCEALGMPCISNFHPWQSYFYGRGGTPDKPFKWTYAHSLGMEDGVVDMIDMWGQVTTNKVVGLLWSNNTDGMAWANEETGMPPALKAAGFTGVQPSMYQPNTDDYTQQISEFKKAGCEIQFGVATGPDFSNFWKQCLQQGYRPKLAGTTKGLGQPKVLDSLGSVGLGLYCEVAWHPTFPFKDSLTGMTCQQLADDYEQASGLQWAPMMGQYAKFEWAVDVLKRTKDLESKEAILTAVVTTKTDTCYGPIDFTSPVKMGTSHPVLNVYKPPYCGGQWRKGTKHAFELFICSNAGGPMVPVQSKIEPMVYS